MRARFELGSTAAVGTSWMAIDDRRPADAFRMAAIDERNPNGTTSRGRALFNGYGDMRRLSCKSASQTITGDQRDFPISASVSLDRSLSAKDISGTLATSYPWIILDHATIHLSNLGVTANFLRFCKLEFRHDSKIVVGDSDLFLLSNHIVSAGGTIAGLDSNATEDAAAPVPASGVGASGTPGKAGASSSSVLIAVVIQLDGSLAIELDGAHGGDGGAGGPAAVGADAGIGDSDPSFDCRRDLEESGFAGMQGGTGGNGGAGGNAGSLQVFRLEETIFPTGAIAYSGRGGPGGTGGQGGQGAEAGPDGAQTKYCYGGNSTSKRPPGANGANGLSGIAGIDGIYRNSTVAEEDIVNFF